MSDKIPFDFDEYPSERALETAIGLHLADGYRIAGMVTINGRRTQEKI